MPPPSIPDEIVKLEREDLPLLAALLRANHLPDDDCAEQAQHFCALYRDGELVAAGGLEPAGDYALLRSIVVQAPHRGQGLARRITEHLLQRAGQGGVRAVYLLTESAADYFTGLGFRPVARADVPPDIVRTRQFSALCPDSASCLFLPLPRA